jgi:hypothetical protein
MKVLDIISEGTQDLKKQIDELEKENKDIRAVMDKASGGAHSQDRNQLDRNDEKLRSLKYQLKNPDKKSQPAPKRSESLFDKMKKRTGGRKLKKAGSLR